MDLVNSVPATPMPQVSSGTGTVLNASVLNPSSETEVLNPEAIVKGVITAVDKAKSTALVYGQTPEGKTFNLEVKLPLIPMEGSEVNIKILPLSQRTPENPFPVKITINPKAASVLTSPVKSESMLQKGVSEPTPTVTDKSTVPLARLENSAVSLKSNIITAEVIYAAKSSEDIKVMQALNPKTTTTEMQTIVKPDASFKENPLPPEMIKPGTGLALKIVQIDVPIAKLPAGNVLGLQTISPAATAPTNMPAGEMLPSRTYEQLYPLPNSAPVPQAQVQGQPQPQVQPMGQPQAQVQAQPQPMSTPTQASVSPVPVQMPVPEVPQTAPQASQIPTPPQLPVQENFKPIPQAQPQNQVQTQANFTISGEVVSKQAVPHTVVANPEMTVSLNLKTEFPTGSLIKMEVIALKLPEIITKTPEILNQEKPPVFAELDKAVKLLGEAKPQVAAELLAKIPQANDKLARNLFNFVQAAKTGDAAQWLGAATIKALDEVGESGRKASAKITKDLLGVSRITSEALGEWRAINIPFLSGQAIQPVSLFIKHLQDEDTAPQTEESKKTSAVRFLFEIELSKIGRTQIDGLTYPKEKQLDLIIRTEKKLPEEAAPAIREIYAETLEAVGYKGTVTFLKTSDFIEIAEKGTAAFIPNSDIWV